MKYGVLRHIGSLRGRVVSPVAAYRRLSFALFALLLGALAFAQTDGTDATSVYTDIQTSAATASAALRTAGVAIVGGFVVAIFAIAFVKKILAAK